MEPEPRDERLDAVVVVVDRLAARLGVQAGGERIVERVHASADAIARLEHDDVPSRVGQVERRGEAGEPRADDDDAGPRARGVRLDARRRRGPCWPASAATAAPASAAIRKRRRESWLEGAGVASVSRVMGAAYHTTRRRRQAVRGVDGAHNLRCARAFRYSDAGYWRRTA